MKQNLDHLIDTISNTIMFLALHSICFVLLLFSFLINVVISQTTTQDTNKIFLANVDMLIFKKDQMTTGKRLQPILQVKNTNRPLETEQFRMYY